MNHKITFHILKSHTANLSSCLQHLATCVADQRPADDAAYKLFLLFQYMKSIHKHRSLRLLELLLEANNIRCSREGI